MRSLSDLSRPFPPSKSSKRRVKVLRESSTNLCVQPLVQEELRGQIHNVSESTLLPLLFYKQEIACHSLLFHYKGEGFTCDLSAREPLVRSRLENVEWSSVHHVCESASLRSPSILLNCPGMSCRHLHQKQPSKKKHAAVWWTAEALTGVGTKAVPLMCSEPKRNTHRDKNWTRCQPARETCNLCGERSWTWWKETSEKENKTRTLSRVSGVNFPCNAQYIT